MIEQANLVDQLRKVEHFKHLSLIDLKAIVLSGHVKVYEAGATLFLEGDPCAGMYVLLTGKVDLCKTGPEGQVTILNTIRPVIMFNEVPVLDNGVNPVCAIAVEKSCVWNVGFESFQSIIAQLSTIGDRSIKSDGPSQPYDDVALR